MTSLRRLTVAVLGAALLLSGTGCQANPPANQGSTVNNAKMPTLPDDSDAAKAVVRSMVMNEALLLLKGTDLRYTDARFNVPIAADDENAQNGRLAMVFQPCSDDQVQAMTAAVHAHGWQEGGKSHGVNVHKGPLFLQWGKGADGCRLEITTVNISQHLRITHDVTNVPELAAFKALG